MGLREKSNVNLEFVTLVGALATLLVLVAARRYTSDWQERRDFRRHLASTQRRLTDEDTPDNNSGGGGRRRRRQWKRFVAAMPLVPVATAYVALRIGWDVFEVLVFCSLDIMRDVASNASAALQSLLWLAWAYGQDVWCRMDIAHRAADMVVALVEAVVTWLFMSAFPAIGRLADLLSRVTLSGVRWWVERGGPAAADAVEVLVLEYLLPAGAAAWQTATNGYVRTVWLATQAVVAVRVLALDLARDLRIAAQWAAALVRWVADADRWWFDARIRRALVLWVPDPRVLLQIRHVLVDQILPRCAWAAWVVLEGVYIYGLRPSWQWAAWLGDQVVLQTVLAVGVHTWRHLLAGTRGLGAAVRLFRRLEPVLGRVAFFVRVEMARVRGAAAQVAEVGWQMAAVCAHVYAEAQRLVVWPVAQVIGGAVMAGWLRLARYAGPYVRGAWVWAVEAGVRLAGVAARAAGAAGSRLSAVLAWALQAVWSAWHGLCDAGWRAYIDLLEARDSSMVVRALHAVAVAAGWVRVEAAGVLWPVALAAARDGARAMADVYAQLVRLVDAVVALVGDLVVDAAQRNVVHHRPSPAGGDGGGKRRA